MVRIGLWVWIFIKTIQKIMNPNLKNNLAFSSNKKNTKDACNSKKY